MKFSEYNLIFKDDNCEGKYILFNTFNGSIFRIDSETKEKIESNNILALSEKVLLDYKSTGIILEDTIDEKNIFEYFHNKAKFDNDLLSITLLLTQACNLSCTYCFEGDNLENKISLNEEYWEKIYKFLINQAEVRKSKTIHIVLFGGEPLLNFKRNKEWLNKIKEFCDKTNRNFSTSIITNGTLITDEILDILVEYNCNMIQITLDGIKEIHDTRRIYKNGKGSFEEVLKGIKIVYNRQDFVKPVIRINIDKENIDNTEDLIELLRDEGLTDVRIDFGIVKINKDACNSYSGQCFLEEDLGNVLEELWSILEKNGFKVYEKPFKKYTFCGLYGDAAFTITPNGDLYKCWEHVGNERHRIGKINNDGNVSETFAAYFEWMSRNPLNIEECKECVYLPACGGGCTSISFNNNGTYNAPGCYKTKGVVEKQLKHYIKSKNI
ncbi:MAG: radical SAM protein [Peptostreptococcaceae bacterium]|nr:radical SAM protein [Peptostreptococcaceae bacterium]